MSIVDLVKTNGGNIGWAGVVIVMVTGAWLTQGQTINDLSLEVGELRSDVKHMGYLISLTTKNCHALDGTTIPKPGEL